MTWISVTQPTRKRCIEYTTLFYYTLIRLIDIIAGGKICILWHIKISECPKGHLGSHDHFGEKNNKESIQQEI